MPDFNPDAYVADFDPEKYAGDAAPAPAPAKPGKPLDRAFWTEPGILRKFLAHVADVSPDLGTGVGGTVGAILSSPSIAAGPVAALAVPAMTVTGAGTGRLLGTQLKRTIDRGIGRAPTDGPAIMPVEEQNSTYREGVSSGAIQGILGLQAQGLKDVAANTLRGALTKPLATELGAAPTPFANIPADYYSRLYEELAQPSPRVAAPPVGTAAEKGMRYATPQVAGAGRRGATMLKSLADQAAEDASVARAGDLGNARAAEAEARLRSNDSTLLGAKGRAVGEIRQALPPRTGIDASTEPPTIVTAAPSEKMVNLAYHQPDSFNAMMEPTAAPARGALADVKSLGMEQKVLRGLKAKGMQDAFEADVSGLPADAAVPAQRAADEFSGLAESLRLQRGGISQRGPGGFWSKAYEKGGQILTGPRSMMMGLRAETPEAAALANSSRLAEIEAARRDMPSLNPAARDAAFNGPPAPPFTPGYERNPASRQIAGTIFDELLKRISARKEY